MTREEQIKLASEDYTECNHKDGLFNDIVEDAFQKGAQWADANPVNPWKKCKNGNMPEDVLGGCKYVFVVDKKGETGKAFRIYDNGYRWNAGCIIEPVAWMPIPELPKED